WYLIFYENVFFDKFQGHTRNHCSRTPGRAEQQADYSMFHSRCRPINDRPPTRKLLPSEGCPKLVVENDPETCHALYIKDNGCFSLSYGLISADDPPATICLFVMSHAQHLRNGEHDAFIKKLVSFFGCEMPLPDGLVISARVRLVFTCGDRAWIKFSAHEGPNGLMVAEDQS
ncbi:hypothetical protein PSTT_14240, partial [Puccinia striiformis]